MLRLAIALSLSAGLAGEPLSDLVYALDVFASPTPRVLVLDADAGTTEATAAISNTASSLRVLGFVQLPDGSILTPDFPEVSQSGTPVDVRFARVNPDGTQTSASTGLTARPNHAYGGYERADSIYYLIATKDGTGPITKRFMRLNGDLTEVAFLEVTDSTSTVHFARGPSGYGVATLGNGGRVLHRLNESSLTLDASVDVDAYLNGVGYDGPAFGTIALAVSGDHAFLDHTTYDTVSGDVRRVLVKVAIPTMTVVGHQEFDAPEFGQELGSASMIVVDGVGWHVSARPHASRWEVRSFDAGTLAFSAAVTSAWPASADYVNPWGAPASVPGRLIVGTDSAASAPISAAAVVTLSSRTVSFTSLGSTSEDGGWYGTLSPVALGTTEAPIPPEPPAQDPTDYVRLAVSINAGSLLASTDVPVVESGISIAFDPLVTLDQGELYPVWEPLRQRGVGDPDHVFYPRGTQATDGLKAYAGETILSWMDRVKAPRLFGKVSDIPALSGDLIDGRYVTLQRAVEYWFGTLQAEFSPRFRYAPVPDLRFATPTGEYDGDAGVALVELFTFQQATGQELTVAQVLRQMLSVCGGQATVLVTQDNQGRVQLVPAFGPDAITEPAIVLTADDVERVTIGDRDPRQSFNSATAKNTVWLEQDDVGILQPAWFQIGSSGLFGLDKWFSPPVDRFNLQPSPEEGTPLQETFTGDTRFTAQRPGTWPISGDAIPGGGGVRLRDSGGTYLVEVAWRRYTGTGALAESGTTGLQALLDEIPTTGAWVEPFRWQLNFTFESVYVNVRARWTGSGVAFSLGSVKTESACFIPPCDLWIVEFNVSDASRGFAPGAEQSATFSLSAGDSLPGLNGGNALAQSEAEFGIQHADLNISVVSLQPAQLREIAEAFVLANIEPKLVREVEQNPRRGFPVRANHVGYRVQLPGGEVGRVPARDVSVDYAVPGAGVMRSGFQAEITEVRLDTTGVLLSEGGGFLLNDDGSNMLEA